ncbi:MAG: hypothetical protein M1837_006906 [Sclerophora amabilis]|nr:MAG: hypothetical protein M1837_006906 [Sclerophora amabilis]
MAPSDITRAIAAGKVPLDAHITATYLAESRDPPAIAGIIFVGCLTTLIVLLRCYARVLHRTVGLDDYVTILSLILFIPFIALSVLLIKLGSGRHIEYIQYVLSNETTNLTETLDFVAHIIYTTTLYVCRLSGLAFYRRLCARHTRLLLATNISAALISLAFLPQVLLIIFHCLPVTSLWPATPTKKFQLSLVLFPGVIVIVISIVRLYLVVQGQWLTDQSWSYNPMLAIENSEIGATLIALSIPGLKPLIAGWSKSLPTSFSKSSTATPSGDRDPHSGYIAQINQSKDVYIRHAPRPGTNDSDHSLIQDENGNRLTPGEKPSARAMGKESGIRRTTSFTTYSMPMEPMSPR